MAATKAKLTDRGMFEIATEEGIVPARYLDIRGTVSWGLGHTHAAGEPSPHDKSLSMPTGAALAREINEAIRVFVRTVPNYAEEVIDVFGTDLAPSELDGLTNWHYNTGGAYDTSAAAKWVRGDKEGAVRILKSWNKITRNGKKEVSDTLKARRAAEARVILHGDYPALRPLPVWGTDSAGRVRWNEPIRVLTYNQFRSTLRLSSLNTVITSPPAKAGGIAAAIAALIAALAAFWDNLGGGLPW